MKKIIIALFCVGILAFPSGVEARKKKKAKKSEKVKIGKFVQININDATAYDLKKIPGISSSKAKAIIAYREENDGIKSLDDLKEITHETKSGNIVHDFATKTGKWKKAMRILVEGEVFTIKGGTDMTDQAALYKHLFPNPGDINNSTVKELSALPGISKKKAQLVVDNRPYDSIDGLKELSHETKSGKTSYDFATSKGKWRKAIRTLMQSERLICNKPVKKKKK